VFFYELPFFECDVDKLTVDAAAHRYGIEGGHRAKGAQVDRHVDLLRSHRNDGGPSAASAPSAPSAAPAPTAVVGLGIGRVCRRRLCCSPPVAAVGHTA